MLNVVALLWCMAANAQYFSKTYSLYAGTNGYISSIQVVDDTVYAMCYVGDSLNNAISIAAFEKFDKYGNRISYNPLTIPALQNIWANNNNLIHTNDGGFAYGAYRAVDSVTLALTLLKYDHFGNFMWYKEILDSNSLSFACGGIMQDSASNYYLSGIYQHKISYDVDMYIVKLDSSGNLIHKNVLFHPGFDDTPNGLAFNNKSHVVLGGDALAFYSQYAFTGRGYMEVYELDTALNLLSSYLGTDTNGPQANSIIQNADGTYTIASTYICFNNILKEDWHGCVAKLDSNFNIIWKIDTGTCTQKTGFGPQARYSNNSNSYITIGQSYDIIDTPQTHINGWVVKYTPNGQILWSRQYRGVTSNGTYGDDNEFNSVGFFSDGSIICAGVATNNDDPIQPSQYGWLLHIDSNGCIPDSNSCGVPLGISEPNQTALDLKVYPNPANNEVNISFHFAEPDDKATLTITNVIGQGIYSTHLISSESLQTISTNAWAPGLYLYRIVSDKGFTASGSFVVSR